MDQHCAASGQIEDTETRSDFFYHHHCEQPSHHHRYLDLHFITNTPSSLIWWPLLLLLVTITISVITIITITTLMIITIPITIGWSSPSPPPSYHHKDPPWSDHPHCYLRSPTSRPNSPLIPPCVLRPSRGGKRWQIFFFLILTTCDQISPKDFFFIEAKLNWNVGICSTFEPLLTTLYKG